MPLRGSAKLDRQFNLVLALLATERGLRKREIFDTVHGYADRGGGAPKLDALEQMFQRDKTDLRALGIPLETVDSVDAPGDNTEIRYRIPKGRYHLPADVTFTPEESALLSLAAEVWRDGSTSSVAQRAITKIRSLSDEPIDAVVGYVPRLRVRGPAYQPLEDAIQQQSAVRFAYLKPGAAAPETRTLDPWAFIPSDGRWTVHGFDHDRQDRRSFLLRRIVGPVLRLKNVAYTPPPPDAVQQAFDALAAFQLSNVAELKLLAGSDADVRLGKRATSADDDTGVIRLHFTDLADFAEELASFGPEVTVLHPPALRDAVVACLRSVLSIHEGTA